MAQKSRKRPAFPLLGLLSFLSILILNDDSILLACVLCALAALSLALRPAKARMALACTFFVAGICVETAAVYFGAWNYPRPDLLGIPLWIPFLWANGALAVADINDWIKWRFA